jgi:hypothetical protein
MILENLNESNFIVLIDKSDLLILKCNLRIEFEEYILKPIIQKAANERQIDGDVAKKIVSSRLPKWWYLR